LHPQISILVKLQNMDLSIEKVEGSREEYPQRIELMKAELEGRRKTTDAERDKLEALEKERRVKERGLEQEIEGIKKSEERLQTVKTNREYQAALKEIALAKELIGKNEEDILNILEELEVLRKELKEKEKNLNVTCREFERENKELTEKLKKFEKQLSTKKKSREKLLSEVDSEKLKMYENIKDRRQGIAVVSVKDGSCQGCYMDIPPQLYNEVQKGTDLIACPNCNRILYWTNKQ